MSERLLTKVSNRLARNVGDDERHRARLHLLDWLACVAGARDTEAGHLGGLISRLGWERATYLGNALEMDDVHHGATGPAGLLEGVQGLFEAMTEQPGKLAGNDKTQLSQRVIRRISARE